MELELSLKDGNIIVQKNKEKLIIKVSYETDIYDTISKASYSYSEKKQIVELFKKEISNKVDFNSDGYEDTENYEEGEKLPYNPENVRYSLKLFSVLTLYDYISGYDYTEEPTIDLRPDFQRNFVWTNKAKSLLIESMLLNIPIPSIYLNKIDSERYFPADGLQRLNAINEFLSGTLKLSGLEYLSSYNGFKYRKENNNDKELPLNIKRKIRDYQITCFVIENSTPDEVKLDIFKRLNTTGISLSSQELRNSITPKKIRDFYHVIEKDDNFKILISNSVNVNRFVHHEFILRFMGSYLWQIQGEIKYNGNMNDLLDTLLIHLKKMSKEQLEKLIKVYKILLKETVDLFGPDAFRKPYDKDKRKGPLNTLLYTQILINLATIHRYNNYDFSYKNVKKEFDEFLRNDQKLMLSLSSATNNIKNIRFVNERIRYFFSRLEK